MKRSYSDLDQHTGDPPFSFGQGTRGPRQPKLYQQQLEPGTNKIKACMQCGTTRTPQWREGPYGPKTLCNACGVKRVRAMKAAQQGKNATHVPQVATGASKKKAAAHAAARTESIELATTLQLLAGNLEAGPPPTKRQARSGQVGGGRSKKASSMQATPAHEPEYNPYDPAAAAAVSAPALGSAVQKAIAAMAAKGSTGGESNPTDSGEEISWSPADHQQAGDAAAGAEASGSRRQRQQQQQLRAAIAVAAAAHLQAAVEGGDGVVQVNGIAGQHLEAQQLRTSLAEGYGAAAEAAHHGHVTAVDEEAAAVANLLSMSAAADEQQYLAGPSRSTSSAGKVAMREMVAMLTASDAPPVSMVTSRSPGRKATHTPPPAPRHVVTVRPRGGPLASAAAADELVEEDVLYLLGPGMTVVARAVAPEQLLEVIRLNETASEAQRSKAAAEAAVEAVEQILQEKRKAAMNSASSAHKAMLRLHQYVGCLNSEHGLMVKARQEQQPNDPVTSAGGSLMQQVDHVAAFLQHGLQPEQCGAACGQPHPLQHASAVAQGPDYTADLSILAPKAEHVDAAVALEQLAEQTVAACDQSLVCDEHAAASDSAAAVHVPQLLADATVLQSMTQQSGMGVDAAGVDAAMCTDAAGAASAPVGVGAVVDVAPVAPTAASLAAQAGSTQGAQQALSMPASHTSSADAGKYPDEAAPSLILPKTDQLNAHQEPQLLGSLQELAALAGMVDFSGADNNGAAAAAVAALGCSPALM